MKKMSWKKRSIAPETEPYMHWLTGPGRPFFVRSGEQDLKIPFSTTLDPEKLTSRAISILGERALTPSLTTFGMDIRTDGGLPYFNVLLDIDQIKTLFETEEFRGLMESQQFGLPLPKDSTCAAPDTGNGMTGKGARSSDKAPKPKVVVGIIDDGLAFANTRFRKSNMDTRVQYAWVQGGVCTGETPDIEFGREYKSAEIDAAIRQADNGADQPDDEIYRRLGVIDYRRRIRNANARRATHGAHIMDVLCGQVEGEGPDDEPIVCVQLASDTTADTSGAGFQPFVTRGIQYIISRARMIARSHGLEPKDLPVVINFSYGFSAGPHDGTHPLERAIDNAVRGARRPPGQDVQSDGAGHEDDGQEVYVVMPAGNSYLAGRHCVVRFSSDQPTRDIVWHVQPDDKTSSYLEIWMPPANSDETGKVEITLIPPSGAGSESPPLKDGEGKVLSWTCTGNGGEKDETLAEIMYQRVPNGKASRGRFFAAIRPTLYHGFDGVLAPSGDWTIRIRNCGLNTGEEVELWIQRDDQPFGHPLEGRQSYFKDKIYEDGIFDPISGRVNEDDDPSSPVRRDGTVSAIGTGEETLVIGGYASEEGYAAPYSSGGRIGQRGKVVTKIPRYMAPSEDSLVHRGVLGTGTRSGSAIALNGTSVAAPQIARQLIELVRKGGSRKDILDKLDEQVKQDEKEIADRISKRHHSQARQPKKTRKGKGRYRSRLEKTRVSHRLRRAI